MDLVSLYQLLTGPYIPKLGTPFIITTLTPRLIDGNIVRYVERYILITQPNGKFEAAAERIFSSDSDYIGFGGDKSLMADQASLAVNSFIDWLSDTRNDLGCDVDLSRYQISATDVHALRQASVFGGLKKSLEKIAHTTRCQQLKGDLIEITSLKSPFKEKDNLFDE